MCKNNKTYSIFHYKHNKARYVDLIGRKDLELIIDAELEKSRTLYSTYEKCKIKFTNGEFKQKIHKDYYIMVYNDNGKKWTEFFDDIFLLLSGKKGDNKQ